MTFSFWRVGIERGAFAGDCVYACPVLMQDFTGVPAVVDLAAMRDAMKALGAIRRRSSAAAGEL